LNIKSTFAYLRRLQSLEHEIQLVLREPTMLTTTTRIHRCDHPPEQPDVTVPVKQGSVRAWVTLRRRVRTEINRVRHALRMVNCQATVEWTVEENGVSRKLTIAEALDLAKAMRDEIQEARFLGAQQAYKGEDWSGVQYVRDSEKKQVKERYKIVTEVEVRYNTKHYRDEVSRLSRKVDLLSAAIEQADNTTETGVESLIDVYRSAEELALAIDAELAKGESHEAETE